MSGALSAACGEGLRIGTGLRPYPSHAFGAGPSRSRSHGRLRRPKSLPHPVLLLISIILLPEYHADVLALIEEFDLEVVEVGRMAKQI